MLQRPEPVEEPLAVKVKRLSLRRELRGSVRSSLSSVSAVTAANEPRARARAAAATTAGAAREDAAVTNARRSPRLMRCPRRGPRV